jgi:chemotaxis protein CheZ
MSASRTAKLAGSPAALGEEIEESTATEPAEVRRLVEEVMGHVKGELAIAETRLFHQFEFLARYIETAKAEIAALRPDDIIRHHIPRVANELDAIAEATEGATNSIMAQAEKIENLTEGLDPERAQQLIDCATTIYEACGFQDISGQRLTKAAKTLQRIDDRITVLVASIGDEMTKQMEKEPDDPNERTGFAGDPELLRGPQRGPKAKSQAEIDRLLKGIE